MQRQCPGRWHCPVSNFGNGHTRVSNPAGALAAKGSDSRENHLEAGGPSALCWGMNAELATARQTGLVSKARKYQKGREG